MIPCLFWSIVQAHLGVQQNFAMSVQLICIREFQIIKDFTTIHIVEVVWYRLNLT